MTTEISPQSPAERDIEHLLRSGKSAQWVAANLAEPMPLVMKVLDRLRNEVPPADDDDEDDDERPATTPRPGPRPLTSVSTPPTSASPPTVDTLVAAATRSTSKRTQALGAKLHDLAGVLRQRLADEREQAERAERDRAVREAAAAEVARLEAALAEARAKAGLGKRKTGATGDRPKKPLSEKQLAQLAKMRAAQGNTDPCVKGCGYVAKTKSGKNSHERNCAGTS